MTSPSQPTQEMSEHTPVPKLVMGHIAVFAIDDENGSTPCDEAVIHFEGDEDSEIDIHCPGALRIAPLIVEAVNSHAALLARNADLEKALAVAISAGNLLLQNSIGCAVNHYGLDVELNGLPGWLIDSKKQLTESAAALKAGGGA